MKNSAVSSALFFCLKHTHRNIAVHEAAGWSAGADEASKGECNARWGA